MALAKFILDKPDSTPISRKFGAPKKVTEMKAWFKAARKVIPEIPNPDNSDYIIHHEEATRDARWIRFDLQNTVGEKCAVIIDRSISLIG